MQEDNRKFIFFDGYKEFACNDKYTRCYTVILIATIDDIQMYFNVHCTILFVKSLTVMNKQYTAETVVSVSRNVWSEIHTEDRTKYWNTSLYLQEDTSPWNSRLRRAQVSYLFLQLLYVITEFISVFTAFGAFAYLQNAHLICVCVCFVLFVSGPALILCLDVASGWNWERCIPEILRLLGHRNFCSVLDVHCYNFRVIYLIRLKFS
jgi:hypothetical protein